MVINLIPENKFKNKRKEKGHEARNFIFLDATCKETADRD